MTIPLIASVRRISAKSEQSSHRDLKDTLDRRMRIIAFASHILKRRRDGGAHDAGKTGQVLCQNSRVYAASLTSLFGSANGSVRALCCAVRRISTAKFSIVLATMPMTAKNIAWRRSRGQSASKWARSLGPFVTLRLDGRVNRRKTPHGPRDGAGRNLVPRRDHTLFGASESGTVAGQLDAEACRFGVHAVAAPDGNKVECFLNPHAQGVRGDLVDPSIKRSAACFTRTESGAENVAGCALMHKAGVRPIEAARSVRKALTSWRVFFDLVDAGNVPTGFFPDILAADRRPKLGLRVARMAQFEPTEPVFRFKCAPFRGVNNEESCVCPFAFFILAQPHRRSALPPAKGIRPEQAGNFIFMRAYIRRRRGLR